MRSRSLSSITGPTSVSGSAGSPTWRASTAGTNSATKSSQASWSTKIRCTEMQLCPANENAFAASLAAVSGGASPQTIAGVALPSSSFTRLRCARSAIPQPTAPEPVKVISLTRSSSTRTSPIAPAEPETTLIQPGGRPASSSRFARKSADSGSGGRRLQHDRAPGGERGRDLVRDEVQGEVERRDRTDDPDRQPQREGELPRAGGRCVHRHHLAGELSRLDGGEGIGRHRALRLDPRGLQRLTRLGGDDPGRLLPALVQQPGGRIEDPRPLVGRQRLAHRPLRRIERPPGLIGASSRDPGDGVAGERRAHLGPLARLHRAAVDQERMVGVDGRHGGQL